VRSRRDRLRAAAAVLIAGAAGPAAALVSGGAAHVAMLFTHPAHGGPGMDMGPPEEFYVVSQRGADSEPVRRDLPSHGHRWPTSGCR